MIEKIGEKIQVLAIISGILSAGVCIFAALICFSKDDSAGWLYVLAALIAFVLAWPLCGFGQLVEDVSAIRQQLESSTPSEAVSAAVTGSTSVPTQKSVAPSDTVESVQEGSVAHYPSDAGDLEKLQYFIAQSRKYKRFSDIQALWDSTTFTHPEYLQSIPNALFSKVSIERVYGGTTPSNIANFCDSMERLASRLESQEQ